MIRRPPALALLSLAAVPAIVPPAAGATADRPRAREAGIVIGTLPPGPANAITDVTGVRVGHATLIRGDDVRTGVTAILPHGGNPFQDKVPGAVFVGNGFGKLVGSTQVAELGEIETPILLTGTLNVPRVADALLDWMLALPGNESVRSVNPLVGETNDGGLNDIRGRHVGRAEVFAALESARPGPVAEGAVGAGTGTIAFGYKGGIGTASRRLPATDGGQTIGVLVQSNFGGDLTINGVPVARELAAARKTAGGWTPHRDAVDGSIMIVIATDAPLDARQLRRLGARAMLGVGRTGSPMSNGSGDYAIAFSTAGEARAKPGERLQTVRVVGNDHMTPLFQAVVEATEEAILNSLFRATTMTGRGGRTVPALPLEPTLELLRRRGALAPPAANAPR
ncbi:MAG: P1 family peptidase [Verrucomicrobia bacterium]|nr:P1 family peptidase [Verrucomicrobiota bacterium]